MEPPPLGALVVTFVAVGSFVASDALAPVFCAVVALFLTLEGPFLVSILGLFVGFFLYFGPPDLLPPAPPQPPGGILLVATLPCAFFLYLVPPSLSPSL